MHFVQPPSLLLFFAGLLLLVSVSQSYQSGPRSKRFAGFGPFSTVGGNFGCVVSQDKLYINGRFTKSLDEAEQEEMRQYGKELERWKNEMKAFVESEQSRGGETNSSGKDRNGKQPEPPKRPSFCSERATTQFVFDGCTVQGDGVFVGDSLVRRLGPDELDQLGQFERKFTAYQEAMANGLKKQMQRMLSQQFGLSKVETETSEQQPPTNGPPMPEAPKSPEFCTMIM